MKYMAIIDADEKPVSCEFIGCNGNAAPYLIGATTSIKVLEQESCDDCISRKAVRDTIFAECSGIKLDIDFAKVLLLQRAIKDLPPVTPNKSGHWIRWYEKKEYDRYTENIPHCKCSECGKEYDTHSSKFIKYCNECGAKMVEPQESEEKE